MTKSLFAASVATILLSLSNGVGAAPDLEGTDWRILQVRAGSGMQQLAPESSSKTELSFQDGRMSGSAGCNRLAGAYALSGDKLSFSPSMAATMMACPPPLMEQEQLVSAALAAIKGTKDQGDTLALVNADGEPTLVLAERVKLPLTGTDWSLTNYNNGKQAITSVRKGTGITLSLADGKLSGKGCNAYHGGYEANDKAFKLTGPIATTRMICPGPEGAAEQDRAYLAALERVSGYRISGDELLLLDAEGKTQARFRAAPAAQ